MLMSNTFSINYKKADSDFSNSMKSWGQIYGLRLSCDRI